jgi:hypothetical protein
MQLEVEALKFYDSTISNLELSMKDVPGMVSFAYYIRGNPFKSLASFENSRPRMEFKKTKVENNNLMRRRL